MSDATDIFTKFFGAYQNGQVTKKLEREIQAFMNDPQADPPKKEVAKMLWDSHCEMGRPTVDGKPSPPDVLGSPFHNPYTFLPFPKDKDKLERNVPTPLTAEEKDPDRFTGILDLEVSLISPLLTCEALPYKGGKGEHAHYHALTIGEDVVLPATGVRGALRNLTGILAGSSLGYVDEEAWLCQGRDLQLGPRGKNSPSGTPANVFLAEVVSPGGVHKNGTIRLGTTKLVAMRNLEALLGRSDLNRMRPHPGKRVDYHWVNESVTSHSNVPDDKHNWKLKLSGRPINPKGKREGLFNPDGEVITLSRNLWAAYCGQNRHGDFPELKKGDLIWLEANDKECTEIRSEGDIRSIQWARWGREGERLLDVIQKKYPHMIPDAYQMDGKVDGITDLFGQVPFDKANEIYPLGKKTKDSKAGRAFAARVRPANLIFENSKSFLEKNVTLAPLSVPHPGCAAFYRAPEEGMERIFHQEVNNHNQPLRGFKVYRTTTERGNNAPWKFESQGVFDPDGKLQNKFQKLNKTVELLPETANRIGRLRLSLRSVSKKEIAILLAACAVDWRLGGGKPFGLGHCRIQRASLQQLQIDGSLCTTAQMIRPNKEIAELPEAYRDHLPAYIRERMHQWQATQEPVSLLRYPRAVERNRQKVNRGGHVWYGRHVSPRKTQRDGEHPRGLESIHVSQRAKGILEDKEPEVIAQPLPLFDPENPQADTLFGYDLYVDQDDPSWREDSRGTSKPLIKIEPFDPKIHGNKTSRPNPNQGQNRNRRQDARDHRRG